MYAEATFDARFKLAESYRVGMASSKTSLELARALAFRRGNGASRGIVSYLSASDDSTASTATACRARRTWRHQARVKYRIDDFNNIVAATPIFSQRSWYINSGDMARPLLRHHLCLAWHAVCWASNSSWRAAWLRCGHRHALLFAAHEVIGVHELHHEGLVKSKRAPRRGALHAKAGMKIRTLLLRIFLLQRDYIPARPCGRHRKLGG